jgi:hypothetical protein
MAAEPQHPGAVKWRALVEACADVVAMNRANRRLLQAMTAEEMASPGKRGEAREALLWMSKESFEAFKQLRLAMREYNATFGYGQRKKPAPEDERPSPAA